MELLDNGMKVIPVRVHLPLQQGLRLSNFRVVWQAAPHVRVHLPLQQGLRPACTMADCSSIVSASASSITTRIKTLVSPAFRMFDDDVRVHLPLQQGLRPSPASFNKVITWSCASASSITTRIKTLLRTFGMTLALRVRVHLPLQQGLRLWIHVLFVLLSKLVRVHLPLQQGLRLVSPFV